MLTIFFISGNDVQYQITIPAANFEYTQWNLSKYTLVFKAEDLPPLGLKVYEFTNFHNEDFEVKFEETDEKFKLGDRVTFANYDPQKPPLPPTFRQQV